MLSVEIVRPMETLIDEVKLCHALLDAVNTKLNTLNTIFLLVFRSACIVDNHSSDTMGLLNFST